MDTNSVEVVSEETPIEKKKFTLTPTAKKVLLWGGAAIGIFAAGWLISATANSGDEEDEEDYDYSQDSEDTPEIIVVKENDK